MVFLYQLDVKPVLCNIKVMTRTRTTLCTRLSVWSVSFRYCPHLRGIFEFSWALCVFLFHPSMPFDLPSHHPQRTGSNNSSGASQHCPLLLVPHHMLKMTITKPLICCGILFELRFSVHSQSSTVPLLILLGLLRINNLIVV